jgi:hypothetical protein
MLRKVQIIARVVCPCEWARTVLVADDEDFFSWREVVQVYAVKDVDAV